MNNFLQQGLTKYLEKTELTKIKNTKKPTVILPSLTDKSNCCLLIQIGFDVFFSD